MKDIYVHVAGRVKGMVNYKRSVSTEWMHKEADARRRELLLIFKGVDIPEYARKVVILKLEHAIEEAKDSNDEEAVKEIEEVLEKIKKASHANSSL